MTTKLSTWKYDGGADVHKAFALSGEPIAEQVARSYGPKPIEQMNASEIAAVNVAKREYQKEYLDYWNSTQKLSGTGRPVDSVIAPLAPFSAARPGTYSYYGYSSIVNILDYTSCVLPVTTADKNIDTVNKDFKPISQLDQSIWDTCKYQETDLPL